MPAVVKALTSPWQARECRRCGCRIGVPWWGHGLAMLPILAILILLPLVPIRDGLWLLIGMTIAFVAHFMLRLVAVPIVSREPDGQRRF
ncbi:hypothetical protein [Metallibacterium scheffleri]|nr:hypothetical protein [Metallibacterium scheffleri]